MTKGATIQLMRMLKPSWIQISLVLKTSCSFSYCTLQRMGYIMTSNPIALVISAHIHILFPTLPASDLKKKKTKRQGHTDGYGHADKSALLQRRPDIVDKVAQEDPEKHGQEDPGGEEAVEEA